MAAELTVEPTVNGYKITAHFSRKLSDGNYGGSEAAVWVEGNIGADATAADIANEAARLFLPARTAVYDELGIEARQDENGLLRESLTPYVSTAQAEQAVNRKFGQTTREPARRGLSVYNNATRSWESFDDAPEWLVTKAADVGVDRVFRNTKRDDPNFVYYTEGSARKGEGHGSNGEPYAFWPPR